MLSTANDVILALGGPHATAELTDAAINSVYNWRRFGKFPARTYLAIQTELEKHGKSAPAELWSMS